MKNKDRIYKNNGQNTTIEHILRIIVTYNFFAIDIDINDIAKIEYIEYDRETAMLTINKEYNFKSLIAISNNK